jgi:hypothetical protein
MGRLLSVAATSTQRQIIIPAMQKGVKADLSRELDGGTGTTSFLIEIVRGKGLRSLPPSSVQRIATQSILATNWNYRPGGRRSESGDSTTA